MWITDDFVRIEVSHTTEFITRDTQNFIYINENFIELRCFPHNVLLLPCVCMRACACVRVRACVCSTEAPALTISTSSGPNAVKKARVEHQVAPPGECRELCGSLVGSSCTQSVSSAVHMSIHGNQLLHDFRLREDGYTMDEMPCLIHPLTSKPSPLLI